MKNQLKRTKRFSFRTGVTAAALATGLLLAVPYGPRAQEPAPVVERYATVLENQIRFRGIGGEFDSDEPIRPGGTQSLLLYFEALEAAFGDFERDLVVNLEGVDVGRFTISSPGLTPGAVFSQQVEFVVPYYLQPGTAVLTAGFVRDNAPGEDRFGLTGSMAYLSEVGVGAKTAISTVDPERKQAIAAEIAKRTSANRLKNGGFELGFEGWHVDENLDSGADGWSRVLNITIDYKYVVAGGSSCRIDFGGGQDVNLFGVFQDLQVEPGRTYELSYYVKGHRLESKSIPCISVDQPVQSADRFNAAPPADERGHGTFEWKRVAYTFTAPAGSDLLAVRIRRFGSGTGGYNPGRLGPISGAVWFDGIQVVPK